MNFHRRQGSSIVEPEVARALQELARHKTIIHLYADILADIQVCEIEGWDKTEFIRTLRELLNSFDIKGLPQGSGAREQTKLSNQ